MDLDRLKARAAEIAEKETKDWLGRTQASRTAVRAGDRRPCPTAWSRTSRPATPTPSTSSTARARRSRTSTTTDYTDFHGGFGVNVVGHAHPKIVEAIQKAADDAIHFAVTTETTVALAEEICERFQLRADAVRELGHRGHDGRDPRGARRHRPRHGSSRWRAPTTATTTRCCSRSCPRPTCSTCGTASTTSGKPWYTTQPTSKGVPKALWDTTIVVPFNDAAAVEAGLRRQPRRDRGGDPRAGDDEHRHRGAATTGTCRRSATRASGTAPC